MGELHRLPTERSERSGRRPQIGNSDELVRLRAENRRLRELLNDPEHLLQRGLRILAGMSAPDLALAGTAALQGLGAADLVTAVQLATSPLSPWW